MVQEGDDDDDDDEAAARPRAHLANRPMPLTFGA